jgi:predicted dehydrogenase
MTDEHAPPQVTIAVIGAQADAPAAARALRSVEGTSVEMTAASDDDMLALLSRPDIDAVAFAGRIADLPGLLRRTLLAGRHAFVATPAALASKHLIALDELARRRGRVMMFDDGSAHDERIAFITRMTAGSTALWRPRYVRALRTGLHGDTTLDEIAVGQISRTLAIIGAACERVSCIAPRLAGDEATADAAMLTLSFDGGAAARIDISLAEPSLADTLTVACDARTIVLDAFDLRAPLQIHASASYRGPQSHGQWAETISEHPLSTLNDQAARAAQSFVDAVRARDLVASNARALAAAARIWEMARDSMARGGEMLDITGADVVAAQRPELQLIHGGGHRVADAPAPELTLVRRTGTGRGVATIDDGPRSA